MPMFIISLIILVFNKGLLLLAIQFNGVNFKVHQFKKNIYALSGRFVLLAKWYKMKNFSKLITDLNCLSFKNKLQKS